MSSKILIGADIVQTESNNNYFENNEMSKLIDNDLLMLLASVEYRIMNLEVPLVDIETPIKKCGTCLVASTKSINGIKDININLLTLANNHILDQGKDGLESTIKVLNSNNINFVGAGNNLQDASEPYIFKLANKNIGVYACAENEFSIATLENCGANPFDPLESLDHINNLKNKCDHVIVLFHGGKEHYRYPSPNLQKVCRKMIEKGADLVVCQHSHCIGCEEKYLDGTIVYGQGNFLFDRSDSNFWKTSILIELTINEKFNINYIPILKKNNSVKLADAEKSSEILTDFNKRSADILNHNFIKDQYREFSLKMLYELYTRIDSARETIIFKVLMKVFKHRFLNVYYKRYYNKKKINTIINTIECEAWRELILMALKENQ